MYFEIIGQIIDIETIADGQANRDLARLEERYGPGRWRKLKGIAEVRLSNGSVRQAEVHWYEAHGIGRKRMKIKAMEHKKMKRRFVICIRNDGSEDLEVGKVYQVLTDEAAARDGYARVVDESGEDYLYPAAYFVAIVLPEAAERALTALSSTSAT